MRVGDTTSNDHMTIQTKQTLKEKRVRVSNCCGCKLRNNFCSSCNEYLGFGGWHYTGEVVRT